MKTDIKCACGEYYYKIGESHDSLFFECKNCHNSFSKKKVPRKEVKKDERTS